MKHWQRNILVLAIGGVALAFTLSQVLPRLRTVSSDTTVDINDAALIARGEYVARTADCVACHTTLGGKPFAGGLPMLTPLGAIYSTNITPDRETGIGGYTFDDFLNATKHGVRKDNSALYPAMPYPSYGIMPNEDIAAMYAYFMSAVEPVRQPNKTSELPPVLNWRWPLAAGLLAGPVRSGA
nr:cytochrome c [Stutzerimonas degradans]